MKKTLLGLALVGLISQTNAIPPGQPLPDIPITLNSYFPHGYYDYDGYAITGIGAIGLIGLLANDLYNFNEELKRINKDNKAPSSSDYKNFALFLTTKYALPIGLALSLAYITDGKLDTKNTKYVMSAIYATFLSYIMRTELAENVGSVAVHIVNDIELKALKSLKTLIK